MAKGFYKISRLNWAIRGALLVFILSALAFRRDFIDHFYVHFTGSFLSFVIKGQWQLVVLNIAAFVSFLIPLSFRRKVDWKEYGLVVAFFVSLFIEMYGIPFTIAMASGWIGAPPTTHMTHVLVITLFGVDLAYTVPMVYGGILMLIGTAWIIIGWGTLYRGIRDAKLVETGIYSVSRNPQYAGFLMIIVGWFIGWPTLLTVIFTPVLLFVYIRLCIIEESEIIGLPGFERYREHVPLLI
jgi:protein-S-isoprenylcysteine O-methyltransferase Ste14